MTSTDERESTTADTAHGGAPRTLAGSMMGNALHAFFYYLAPYQVPEWTAGPSWQLDGAIGVLHSEM